MSDFDNLLRCTIGSSSFQLDGYKLDEQAIIAENRGRTGTRISITGTGWTSAASAAAHNAAVLAVSAGMRISGQNFTIYGLGGLAEYQILAAQCLDGGPHVSFGMGPDGGFQQKFTFTVEARKGLSDFSGPGTAAGFTERVESGPDGLRRVTRSGESLQSGSANYFHSSILPAFRSAYPPSEWVISPSYETDQADRSLKWQIAAEELLVPYEHAAIIDGEASEQSSRDEAHRLVKTLSFDFLLSGGDPQPVIDILRGGAMALGPIIRERLAVTVKRKHRLSASFEILTSADGNDLVNWQQSINIRAGGGWEEHRFPGGTPIAVKRPGGLTRIIQQGRAIGVGVPIAAPDPIYPELLDDDASGVTFDVGNDYEISTNWQYAMLVSDPAFTVNAALIAQLQRPTGDPRLP